MHGLDYFIKKFLLPHKAFIHKQHDNLKDTYPELKHTYIYYQKFLYFRIMKKRSEGVHGSEYMSFDGDPPKCVMKYIRRVDEYHDAYNSLSRLFHKISTFYSEDEAKMLLPHIEDLQTLDVSDWNFDLQVILEDIRENNQEQLALITKINTDNFLLG